MYMFIYIEQRTFSLISLYEYYNAINIRMNLLFFSEFRLAYYPHKLAQFKEMLMEAFGKNSKHTLFADFKSVDEVPNPAFYIHVVQKGFH